MGSNWTGGWNASNLLAMYSLANATAGGGATLVAVLCGPVPGAPRCHSSLQSLLVSSENYATSDSASGGPC